MSGVGSIISGVGDIFAAGDYGKAASLYQEDVSLAKESTALKETAANRAIFQSMGATRTQTAGAGFKAGGTFNDILRSSAQQASQYKSQISIQGMIDENNFSAQAAAAEAQQTTQEFGAAAGIAGGGASLALGGG